MLPHVYLLRAAEGWREKAADWLCVSDPPARDAGQGYYLLEPLFLTIGFFQPFCPLQKPTSGVC